MRAEKHSPADCALVVAIPVTKEEFERDAVLGAAKDFAPNIVGQYDGHIGAAWTSYRPFALYLAEVAKYAQDHGVLVKTSASLADWVPCLKSRSVVTLVAHCKMAGQPEVEFADRLYTPAEIVSAIPNSYAGTLDFTVCHSLKVLVPPIKRTFPACSVIANREPAHPDKRLALYHQALRLLQSGEYSFVEALTTAQLAAMEEKKRQLAIRKVKEAMTDFDRLVVRYSIQAPTLGPNNSFPAPELRKDLLMLIQSNGRYFAILFGLLVALLILVIVLVAMSVREPQKAVALLVGSTAVTFFLFRTMLRAWEVKSKSDALLILASSLDEKALRAVVLALSQPPRDAKKE